MKIWELTRDQYFLGVCIYVDTENLSASEVLMAMFLSDNYDWEEVFLVNENIKRTDTWPCEDIYDVEYCLTCRSFETNSAYNIRGHIFV